MSWSKTASLWMIALGAMVFATGCPEGGPKVYQVTGAVTIGGQPAKDVNVNFQPVDPKGLMASGTVNNGTYELVSGSEGKKGTSAGKYKVYLSVNNAAASEAMMKAGPSSGGPPAAPVAPYAAAYGSADTTPLEVEVKTSANKIDVVVPGL